MTVRGSDISHSRTGQIITTMFYCRLMFFIIFNFKPPSLSPPPVLIWHELQAAIKEKQKELSEANGFLDLALSYFNPSWILPRLLMSNCCLPGGSWFSIIANPSLKCRQVTRTLQPQPRVGSLPFFPTSHWLFHLPPIPDERMVLPNAPRPLALLTPLALSLFFSRRLSQLAARIVFISSCSVSSLCH